MLILLLLLLTLITFYIFLTKSIKSTKPKISSFKELPKPYTIIGHLFAFAGLTRIQIFERIVRSITKSPTSTVIIHIPFRSRAVFTGDPATVEHILKTKFHIYEKGPLYKDVFNDIFGDSLFTQDGENWKSQRQFVSKELFTHKSIEKFTDNVVNLEISERLIPTLLDAAKKGKVIDLQDIFQRFAFDNICVMILGHDLGYLSPSLADATFSRALDEAMSICHKRYYAIFPIQWKICKFLNIGSEKRLKGLIRTIREFASRMIESAQKSSKTQNRENSLLSKAKNSDLYKSSSEKFIIDGLVSIILAGQDTTSAALTWFFWLLHKNNHVEEEILQEIKNQNIKKTEAFLSVELLKEMPYTHAALCETMRLYPPVPVELKHAASDDVLPDGTKVKKGMTVGYFMQAMGWSEKIWGPNWAEFKPDRWLKDADNTPGDTKRCFIPRDAYSYPVFLGGPRICLGKDMAFLQMKSIVAAILNRFKVIPAIGKDAFEPVYVPGLTAKMRGGFPVKIEERVQVDPTKVN